VIYLIGSLRNPEVPKLANRMRAAGLDVFDAWYSAGPIADDSWRDHEKSMGHTFKQALKGAAAKNVFEFDKRHLEAADAAVLVLPAGKSGHLELGWFLRGGKPGYILLDNPERFDVMYQFATDVFETEQELIEQLRRDQQPTYWYDVSDPQSSHIQDLVNKYGR
jgi:nucleoside 2-deoxyribosyltransferase